MAKKNSQAISTYYKSDYVVKDYNNRRFSGVGGKYVNKIEILGIISLAKKLKPPVNKPSILDIGAGRGRISIPLQNLGYSVYCLDSSSEMMKFLRKTIPSKNLFEQSAFDILPNKKFDIITSLRFFDHFSISDMEKILLNVKKNSSKSGIIIFTCLNKLSLESLVSNFFYYKTFNYYYYDKNYQKLFNTLNLTQISRNSGFIIPRGSFLFFQKIPFLAEIAIVIDSILLKLFPWFGAYYIYVLKNDT